MGVGAVPDLGDPGAVVGRLAVHLGREGAAGLAGALEILVEGCGLRSAVLRALPGGELVAVAGEVVQAVPVSRRDLPSVVELSVRAPSGGEVAVLTVTGGRPVSLPVLRAAASVLALAVTAPVAPVASAAPLLLDLEGEVEALADRLHDGPVQALVAARYAADLAARTGDLSLVREAVQEALVQLRRTMGQLRPRGADGLVEALEALGARLAEAGGPVLSLHLDAEADVRDPAQAVGAYRLVQAACRDLDADQRVVVGLAREDEPSGRGVLVLTVDGAALPDPARWRRTAAALGADLLVSTGRLRLALPVPDPAPSRRTDIGTAATTKAVL